MEWTTVWLVNLASVNCNGTHIIEIVFIPVIRWPLSVCYISSRNPNTLACISYHDIVCEQFTWISQINFLHNLCMYIWQHKRIHISKSIWLGYWVKPKSTCYITVNKPGHHYDLLVITNCGWTNHFIVCI